MALCGGWCCQASGSNLTFESALGLLLGQRPDKAGHAAIRTVKRWVVLPIADLPGGFIIWSDVTLRRIPRV